ncbi:hypothetical protein WKK05_07945 [Nostoc sp. UHCC 0302]|uniref:hypothetical protein n=1 Tax=Nostoc sp. UHCC 0302 TaxID=3134896 RepID=UPI00311CC74C
MQSDSNSPYHIASTNNDSNSGKFLIPRSQRRRFFIQFTLMTVLGWIVGGIASIAIEKIILESLAVTAAQQSAIFVTLVRFLSNIIFAVVFAADQALVLYRYLPGWLWILATSLGWLIANTVSTAWIGYISSVALSLNQTLSPEAAIIFGFLSTIAYIFSGIWLGICQWLVLRRYTADVWWWNFLPSISFFFISVLIGLLSLVQDLIPEANRTWIGQGFAAVMLGIIPAIGLCTLQKAGRQRAGNNTN